MSSSLYLATPFSMAILQFFGHLREDILSKTTEPGSVKAYIFGGCALHIHTNARVSNDIDVEFSSAEWMRKNNIVISKPSIIYAAGPVRRTLELDSQFTPVLGPLHEDYQDDAILLQKHHLDSPLWLYVVTPEDLAVSKLGRFGERDREDILTLLKMKKMTVDNFRERATEALKYYVGSPEAAKSHLDYVIWQYNQLPHR